MKSQNNHKKEKQESIKITVKYSNPSSIKFIYNINEKIEKLITEFSEKIKLPKDYYLIFLYSGKLLEKDQTFSQVINNIDKQSSEMVIIAQSYKSESNIIITLNINSENEIDLEKKKRRNI